MRASRAKARAGDEAGAAEHPTHALAIVNSIATNVADEKRCDNFLTAARSSLS